MPNDTDRDRGTAQCGRPAPHGDHTTGDAMRFTEAAEARDRLERRLDPSPGEWHPDLSPTLAADIALVCAWTRHWEHACAELDAMLAAEKARAARLKVYTPDTPTGRSHPYRIALRPYDEGAEIEEAVTPLDDVVVRDVSMFRMEDMGDSWFLCCYLDDEGDRIAFSVPTTGKRRGQLFVTEMPDVVYETRTPDNGQEAR